jgi:hypothetical protein
MSVPILCTSIKQIDSLSVGYLCNNLWIFATIKKCEIR